MRTSSNIRFLQDVTKSHFNFSLSTNKEQKFNEDESSKAVDWWNVNGPVKALHDMNQVLIPLIRDGLIAGAKKEWKRDEQSDVLNEFKILHVSCGAGIISEALAMLGVEVVAIDPLESLIAVAKNHLSRQTGLKVTYICETIEDHLVNSSKQYDAVVLSEIVEHVVDQKAFMTSCAKASKQGGSIFITTFTQTWTSWFWGIIMAEFVLGWIPKNTHNFDLFIVPEAVSEILSKSNCRTTKVSGYKYNPWKRVYKLEKTPSCLYVLQAIKS